MNPTHISFFSESTFQWLAAQRRAEFGDSRNDVVFLRSRIGAKALSADAAQNRACAAPAVSLQTSINSLLIPSTGSGMAPQGTGNTSSPDAGGQQRENSQPRRTARFNRFGGCPAAMDTPGNQYEKTIKQTARAGPARRQSGAWQPVCAGGYLGQHAIGMIGAL